MKTFYLLLIFVLSYNFSIAQSYAKLLDTKAWIILQDHPGPGQCGCSTYAWWVYDKDTIIASQKYAYLKYHAPGLIYTPHYFLREDTILRRVYSFTDSGEILMYSFLAMAPGQSDTIYGHQGIVDSITTINTVSGIHRVFQFSVTNPFSRTYKIAEGIGEINYSGCVFDDDYDSRDHFLCSYDFNIASIYSPYTNIPCQVYASIDELNYLQLVIYPNPSKGKIFIKSETHLSAVHVSVNNTLGQTIFIQEGISGNEFEIDVQKKAEGLYIIRIEDKDGNVYARKILIE
jgi:hypothetical protein